MSPRLIVWDFDGTLADSLPTAVAIFNRLAPELGHLPLLDVAAAREMTTRQLLKQQGISLWRLPKLVRAYHAASAGTADHIRLVAGLSSVLAELRHRGVRLGILSSNREDNIRRSLRANGAEEHFAFVIGYPRLFGKGKALRRILRSERLAKTDLLYIGDEMRDVEAAKKAGVAVAAVTWGFHAEQLLRTSPADFFISEPRQLLDLVGEVRAAG